MEQNFNHVLLCGPGSHPAAAVPRQPQPELLPVPTVRPPALRAGGLSAGDRPPAAAGAVSPVPRRSRHRHRPASLLQQPQRTGATAGGVGLCPDPPARWRGAGESHSAVRVLCKPPTLRCTPLGREICDIILAVNRRYGRADYLPLIAWGTVARQTSILAVGARLTVEGRIQSRTYTKNLETGPQERVAYEVSVMRPAELSEFAE